MTYYSGLAPLWSALAARKGVRILAYHGVTTPPDSPFAVSVENFEKQMSFLKANYNVIGFQDYLDWRDNRKVLPDNSVIVTFDDGFKNLTENAVPVLTKHTVPATFFIIAGKMIGDDKRFMTEKDISTASSSPLIDIGSHSLNHLSLAQISSDDRRKEALISKQQLEAGLSKPIEFFCYPYGTFNDFDESSCRALAENGYSLGCTSVNGVNFKSTNPYKLRRNKVEWSDDIGTFSRQLKGALDPWILVDFFLRFLQRPRAVKF